MAEYGKLFSRIWNDPEFTSLDARAQQVYALLVSHSTRNHAGVLPLTLKRWAGSTADSTVENVTAALKRLAAKRFVVIDWDSEELLVRTFIRNDEIYKQPNLMVSALRFCRDVLSPRLRWALFDELTKLPDHKDRQKTEETANALVEGLERTPAEPIEEPFAEPIGDDPGVGGYLSAVGEHRHLQPAPSPTPPPQPKNGAGKALARFSREVNRTSRSSMAFQIAQAFSASQPVPIEGRLLADVGVQIDYCLNSQIPPPAIAAGLQAWNDSDAFATSQIPRFVMKANRGRVSPGVGKPTAKALGYDDAANQLLAELGVTQ